MLNTIVNFITNNTELFNLNSIHFTITFILMIVPHVLHYLSFRFGLFGKRKEYVFIYILAVGVLLFLNIIDNLYPVHFIVYIMGIVLPFIYLTQCNNASKWFVFLTFNTCYFVCAHLTPFFAVQQYETWVYVFLVLSINTLYLYLSLKKIVLVVIVLLILNFFIISGCSIIQVLELNEEPVIRCLLMLLGIFVYLTTLLLYYLLSRRYQGVFIIFCKKIDNYNRVQFLLISSAIATLSLSLRYIYIFI